MNDPSAAHRRAPALAEQRVVLAGAFPGPDLPNGADLVDADLLIVSFTAVPGDVSVLAALPRSGRRRLACPVIVVRGGQLRQPIHTIVVGLGTGDLRTAALGWAIEEAAIQRADLVLVHAWQRSTGTARSR